MCGGSGHPEYSGRLGPALQQPIAPQVPGELHGTAAIEPEQQCVWRSVGESVGGIQQLTCSVPSDKSSGFTGGRWHLKSLSSNLDISSDLCHDLRSLNLLRIQVSHARGPYT